MSRCSKIRAKSQDLNIKFARQFSNNVSTNITHTYFSEVFWVTNKAIVSFVACFSIFDHADINAMKYLNLIKKERLPISVKKIASTVLVFGALSLRRLLRSSIPL